MTYRIETAAYSSSAWFATILPFIIIGILALSFPPNDFVYSVVGGLVGIGIYFWAPRYYLIADNAIMINRLIGNVVILKSSIKSIEVVEKLSNQTRLFGSGGLFGYFGIFKLNKGERAHLYCTRLEQLIVIKTTEKIIILSPNDPVNLIKLMNFTDN